MWGLGLLEGQGQSRFLHDGRAKTLEQAILWHGGEADSSRRRYQALNDDERQLLLQFLRSI
ncbi:MAG: di-heme oxidoredictase family protein [Pseudomonadota bacterium]